MTFDEFISIFIEDCEDHLELFNKGDFDKVFTYLDKNINIGDGEDLGEDIQQALNGLSDLDNG